MTFTLLWKSKHLGSSGDNLLIVFPLYAAKSRFHCLLPIVSCTYCDHYHHLLYRCFPPPHSFQGCRGGANTASTLCSEVLADQPNAGQRRLNFQLSQRVEALVEAADALKREIGGRDVAVTPRVISQLFDELTRRRGDNPSGQ